MVSLIIPIWFNIQIEFNVLIYVDKRSISHEQMSKLTELYNFVCKQFPSSVFIHTVLIETVGI
jgi:hypothetical protein